MLRKFLEARDRGDATVTLWGDGSPTREFLYVEDAAEGIAAAAERYEDASPVNLGSGEEISMKTLAETVRTLTGFPGERYSNATCSPSSRRPWPIPRQCSWWGLGRRARRRLQGSSPNATPAPPT